MKNIPKVCNRVAGTLAAALAMALPATAQVLASDGQGEYVRGRLLVATQAGLSESELGKIVGVHGGKARALGRSPLFIVDLPAQASETAVAQHLARNPHLKFAELDRRAKPALAANDPYLGSAWHLGRIGAAVAWDSSQGSGVVLAVLDCGVDGAHPDLAARIVAGWNFVDKNTNTADINGHGTGVACAAAASTNNGLGVAGVAGQSKIMPLRICGATGYALWSTVAEAITYAADKGARVANISFSGLLQSAAVQPAAQYMKSRGGLVVVAAGNNGINENLPPSTAMIAVSATDSNDVFSTWSSYGSFVALSAPGYNIWTTTRGGGNAAGWGTSFASPVVAGTIALMMAAKPSLSSAQVESLLFASATDLGAAGRDIYYGHCRVNAGAAVLAAAGATPPAPDTTPPAVALTSPTAGGTVSGLVAVSATASDNLAVPRVELRINGLVVASDSARPFGFSWDTTQLANGAATLAAVAYDAAGSSAASVPVSVTVANAPTPVERDILPPVVVIASPLGGIVTGVVTIAANASDNSGAAGITQSLYIDGVLKATAIGGGLSFKWNTRKSPIGVHNVQVLARDAAGILHRLQ